MIKIRRDVFETNSSSTHSISVKANSKLEKSYLLVNEDNYIEAAFGEFGWEIASYNFQHEKLSYLLTICAQINGFDFYCKSLREFEVELDKFYSCSDFHMIADAICAYTGCKGIIMDAREGYVDHQSYEDYTSLSDYLDSWGVSIEEFVFGNAVIVNTDNDNH